MSEEGVSGRLRRAGNWTGRVGRIVSRMLRAVQVSKLAAYSSYRLIFTLR